MATKTAGSTLPGRKHGGLTGREVAVKNYRDIINERQDLTADEKRAAVQKYATGMGVDLAKIEG